ncbi:MAG: glycosyltransferase family 4 protein [Rhizobium sp.]|nr:glycosyltransferase family 4 protein [Rhizobium sp.]
MTPFDGERPLNILQVLEPSGGGSGRHFVDLCGGLVRRGHRVTAIYSPRRAEPRFVAELKALPLYAILPVAMRRAPSPADFRAWRDVRAIARSHGPFDIIHGHSSKAGALTRLHLPGTGPRRIYTPHAFRTMDPTLGKFGRVLYGQIEGLFGRFLSDAVICVSDDERRHALDQLGIPEHLLTTVVNGVAPPPLDDRDAVRARLGLRQDSFVFGFVGRLSPQKAPERLVEAFRRVASQNADVELVMIGFGELESDVKIQIMQAHLSERVHLGSEISGAVAMQAFDALVMPSRYEAMSYVMLEAAAAGLPMVLTDVGGGATVVDNGVNGLVVPNSDDPTELTAAMIAISSPQRMAAMRQAARHVANRFTVDRMVSATEAVYRRVCGRREVEG